MRDLSPEVKKACSDLARKLLPKGDGMFTAERLQILRGEFERFAESILDSVKYGSKVGSGEVPPIEEKKEDDGV